MAATLEIEDQHQPNIEFAGPGVIARELEIRFGFQHEEVESIAQQAEALQPFTRVAVRIPLAALVGILHDQHIHTVSETRTSNGLTAGADKDLHRLDEYISLRRQFESEKLGWSEDEQPIIYGFLGYSDELGDNNVQAPTYGRIELKFRAEVADRSSFTIGDSLMKMFDDNPPELLTHDDATIVQQAIEFSRQQPGHDLNQIPYVEAQIRGGLSTQDIESATITIKPNDLKDLAASLQELHLQSPDCKIIVNLDYTTAQRLPIELIESLPFVEFRPVVISRKDPIYIERKTAGYEIGGGESQEYNYQETRERASELGKKFIEFFAVNHKPENLHTPTVSHFRNGDRFPPKG